MGLLAKVEKPGDPLSEILTTAINAVEELQDQAGEEPDEPGDGGEDDA